MRVEFGLFEGDNLLYKGTLNISEAMASEERGNLKIAHKIEENIATITIEPYENGEPLTKSTLDMPIHESEDWESIELAQFTLAFNCKLKS